ncbi:hypothetical protein [Niveispirillum sp. KHB5.9]|uniref:hypothetical protein n=1 Tax=Niveispirillum sp. KHB5.9 TaxID=3400269 RepID=UPI003A88AAB8
MATANPNAAALPNAANLGQSALSGRRVRRAVPRGALAGSAATYPVDTVAEAPAQQSRRGVSSITAAGPDGPMVQAYYDFLEYQRAFNTRPLSADQPDDDAPYLELERLRNAVTSIMPENPIGMAVLALMLIWDSDAVVRDIDIARGWDGLSEPPVGALVENNIALWNIAYCGWIGLCR